MRTTSGSGSESRTAVDRAWVARSKRARETARVAQQLLDHRVQRRVRLPAGRRRVLLDKAAEGAAGLFGRPPAGQVEQLRQGRAVGPRRRCARGGGPQGVEGGGILGLGARHAQGACHEDEAVGQGIAALCAQPAPYAVQFGRTQQGAARQQVQEAVLARLDTRAQQLRQDVGGHPAQHGAGGLVHGGRAVLPPVEQHRDERGQVPWAQEPGTDQRPLGQHPFGAQLHRTQARRRTGEAADPGVGDQVDAAAQIRTHQGERHLRLGPAGQGQGGGVPAFRVVGLQHGQQPGLPGGRARLIRVVGPNRSRGGER
jgi:hypothetical protein